MVTEKSYETRNWWRVSLHMAGGKIHAVYIIGSGWGKSQAIHTDENLLDFGFLPYFSLSTPAEKTEMEAESRQKAECSGKECPIC